MGMKKSSPPVRFLVAKNVSSTSGTTFSGPSEYPEFITGKRVLEIGPGIGQKAQHLLAYDPDGYVAVDGNDSSVRMAGEAIRKSGFAGSQDLRKANFTEYEDVDVYDLVLAESLVPTQSNPEDFLARLRSFVEPAGGVLIYTCMDAVSLVSEMLRRCIVRHRGFVTDDLQFSAERIADFFGACDIPVGHFRPGRAGR